jgi:hypothetical protein
MPASIGQPPIPAPNGSNTVQVLEAIRNALIAMTNTSSSQASASGTVTANTGAPQPSTFVVKEQVVLPVTYPLIPPGTTGGSYTVTVPVLTKLTLLNPTTNEKWSWSAPGSITSGGTPGAAL